MTSYFSPEHPTFTGYNQEDGPVAHVPKVRTVSGEETYPGGGVAHHQPIFEDSQVLGIQASDAHQDAQYSFRSAFQSVLKSMQNDLGISQDVQTRAAETTTRANHSTRTILNEARDSLRGALGGNTGSGSSSASYSTASGSYSGGNTRPLNEDERRGVYVLGGIVAAGFALGGLGKQSKRKAEKVRQDISQQVEQIRHQAQLVDDAELSSLVSRAEAALRA